MIAGPQCAALGAPPGSVQFFDGGTAISGLIALANGKASFSTAAPSSGCSVLWPHRRCMTNVCVC